MKIEHWTAILILLFLAMFLPFYYSMHKVGTGVKDNNKAEASLYASCEDAITETDPGTEKVFGNREKRLNAMNAFYDTLSTNYNFGFLADSNKDQNSDTYISSAESARYHVPCVVMIDWDGFYVNYTKDLTGNSGNTVASQRNLTTEKYAFGQNFSYEKGGKLKVNSTGLSESNIRVSYRLDDGIVIDVLADKNPDGKRTRYEGDIIKAYTQFADDWGKSKTGSSEEWGGSDALLEEWFGTYNGKKVEYKQAMEDAMEDERQALQLEQEIKDYAKKGNEPAVKNTQKELEELNAKIKKETKELRSRFKEFKNKYIASIVEPQIEYFINLHNTYYNMKQADYTFTMPNIREKDLHKMFDSPCVIAFFQGKQTNDGMNASQYINVYSICGAELQEMQYYEIAPVIRNGQLVYYQMDDKATDENESNNEILVPYNEDMLKPYKKPGADSETEENSDGSESEENTDDEEPADPLVMHFTQNGNEYYLKLEYHMIGHELTGYKRDDGETYVTSCKEYDNWINTHKTNDTTSFCAVHRDAADGESIEEFSDRFFKQLGIPSRGTAKECARYGANPCGLCTDLDNP